MRRSTAWRLGLGVAGATAFLVFALLWGVDWSIPLVACVVLLALMPAAKAIGARKAFEAGARLRRRHDA